MSDICDVPDCELPATRPVQDPYCCDEHWAEYLEWSRGRYAP